MANPRKKADIEIDPDTVAQVIETTNSEGKTARRVSFPAKVIENEIEDDTDGTGTTSESEFDSLDSAPEIEIQEIPKTALDRMFDYIREQIAVQQIADTFFAHIVRQPDDISSQFVRPCDTELDLGIFQFKSTDRFSFLDAIQKRAGNTGGIFNIRIFKLNRQELRRPTQTNRFGQATDDAPIGLFNYHVPNPYVESEINAAPAASGFDKIAAEMARQYNDMMAFMREQSARQNQNREPTLIEKALERKLLSEIENPNRNQQPQGADIAGEVTKTMLGVMTSVLAAPAMVQRMLDTAMPVKENPPEPDAFDKLDKFAESKSGQLLLPVLTGLIDKAGDTAQAFAVKKMNLEGAAAASNGGYAQPETDDGEKDEMQVLMETIVAEIETENPLDDSNAVIQQLRDEYPDQADDLVTTCQALPFDAVFNLLVSKTRKMKPSPFMPFLNLEETQKQQKYIWNERGERARVRLEEFYNYLKSLPA